MSLQDNVEKSQLDDKIYPSEGNSHFATADTLESSDQLIPPQELSINDAFESSITNDFEDPNCEVTLDEETRPTAEAVDTNLQTNCRFEETHPTVDLIDSTIISDQELLVTPCRVSDSSQTSISSDDTFEDPCGVLGRSYRRYTYLVNRFRTFGHLLPLQILCFGFAISVCFMGAYNWPMCPADFYIPRYVFISGAFAALSFSVRIIDSLHRLVLHRYDNIFEYIFAFCFAWVAIVITAFEMSEFYSMSYSFNRRDQNYCSETFYWFVHYKNIALAVILLTAAAIHLPGCNLCIHHAYWQPTIF